MGVSSRLRVGHFLPAVNVLPEEYPGVQKDLGDTEGVIELLKDDTGTGFIQKTIRSPEAARLYMGGDTKWMSSVMTMFKTPLYFALDV